jgi:peptidyl-prolyl cis-trans isomerase D
MLQKMRDQTQSTAFKVLVGIIVFVLAVFGFGTFNLFSTGDPGVASVNGEDITQNMIVSAAERERRRIAAQLGGEFDPDLIDPVRLQSAVLEQLVARSLMSQAAEDLGVGVSRAQIDAAVVRNPSFQLDGVFSQDTYLVAVRSLGFSPQDFLEETGEMLTLQHLQNGISGTAILTGKELREQARLLNQRRDVAYLGFDPDAFSDQVDVSEEEVTLRYEENQLDYMTEESVDLEYVALSWQGLLNDAEVAVSEEDIVSAYESDRALAPASEERRSRHILLQVSDERTAEEAEATLRELKARVEAGEDFAALAAEYSEDPVSAKVGGDLGFVGTGIFDPAFEAALFSMEIGAISDPVRSDFGYHLIRLDEVRTREYPTLEEQRAEIEMRLKRAQAEALFVDRVRELDNLAFEEPNSLQGIADEMGLEIQQVAGVTRDAGDGLFDNAELREAAFSEEVLESGFNSAAVEYAPSAAVVMRVTERHEPVPIAFDEVEQEIRDEIVAERSRLMADAAHQSALARIRAGESVSAVADEYGLQWQRYEMVRRNSAEVPAEILQSAFSLRRPTDGGKSVGEAQLPGGERVVITVTRVADSDADALSESEISGVRAFLADRAARTDFEGFYQSIEANASIRMPE